jgi:hypothetical protein
LGPEDLIVPKRGEMSGMRNGNLFSTTQKVTEFGNYNLKEVKIIDEIRRKKGN